MKHIYIVNSIRDVRDGNRDIIIGVFEDLAEAKKCAEASAIIKERFWAKNDNYFDVRRAVLKGEKPWSDRFMVTACWQDTADGSCHARKQLYCISRLVLNHCITETELYKSIVKGL